MQRYGKELPLKKHCATRWGSVLQMLERLCQTEAALFSVAGFITDHELRDAICETDDDGENKFWTLTRQVIDVLRPICTAVEFFESDSSFVKDVIARLNIMVADVQTACCPHLRDIVERRLNQRVTKIVQPVHKAAHLLDPNFRGGHLIEEDHQEIRAMLKTKFPAAFEEIWKELLYYRAKSGVFASVDVWQDAALVDGKTWWLCHGGGAASLQKVALALCEIPCSSAAAERAWSAMGAVHDLSRNRLTDDKVEKLTYIYFNERLI